MKRWFIAFFLLAQTAAAQLPAGWYRASVLRPDGAALVFNFEAQRTTGSLRLYIRNGSERLLVEEVREQGDSLFAEMPFFEARLRFRVLPNDRLTGTWSKGTAGADLELPVTATPGGEERFPGSRPASGQLAPKWAVTFTRPNGTERPALALFEQNGSAVTGTFLTPSGDYRYLEGVLDADTLRLSCFDGSRAYLFTAALRNGQLTAGRFYSNAAPVETWRAVADARATLPDTVLQTQLKPGFTRLSFRFPDLTGQPVSLDDERFRGKVVVVQLMGSWCPNCLDESRFLSTFYNEYREKGVEVVALAYELTLQSGLGKLVQRIGIRYPVLVAPVTVSDPQKTEKTLPQLNSVHYFPTTIFLAKDGSVHKIHQGFYGPGTGEYFTRFRDDFYRTINRLLNE